MRLSERARDLPTFRVMSTLARAKSMEATGRNILHLEAGEPDFATPEPILQAVAAAIEAGLTRYTESAGLPELRLAIAKDYDRRYGLSIDPERVIITPGATGALQIALMCATDIGGRVVMPDPCYPSNRRVARLIGAEPVLLNTDESDGFRLHPAAVEACEDFSAIMIASPANPTGALCSSEDLDALARIARSRSARLIVDELYLNLSYDGAQKSVATLADDVFVINGFSKYYGMTGWRLGWLVAPEDCAYAAARLAENLFLAPPTVAQYGALAAFEPDCDQILQSRVRELGRRRDYLVPQLQDLGFKVPKMPGGAFYVYADSSDLADSSRLLCDQLLDELGIATAPGCDFGQYRADDFLRFTYTTPMQQLEQAVALMRDWLKRA